jgi:hypothetical protein
MLHQLNIDRAFATAGTAERYPAAHSPPTSLSKQKHSAIAVNPNNSTRNLIVVGIYITTSVATADAHYGALAALGMLKS